MKSLVFRVFAASIVIALCSQAAMAAEAAAALERLTDDIRYLSSDELEGRGVGTSGLQQAAEHIRDRFKKLGLASGVEDGSYFQTFDMPGSRRIDTKKSHLRVQTEQDKAKKLKIGKQFQALAIGGSGEAKGEVVFVGYGISAPDLEYDEYDRIDVKDKIVVLIRREPQQDDDESVFDGKAASRHAHIRTKLQAAKDHGATAVLMVNDTAGLQRGKDVLSGADAFGGGRVDIPFAYRAKTFSSCTPGL